MRKVYCVLIVLVGFAACHELQRRGKSGSPADATGDAAPAVMFAKQLQQQGTSFTVESLGEGSIQRLRVTARNADSTLPVIRESIDGRVTDARVADLDRNGRPELYVFVQNVGSGAYGELKGYEFDKKQWQEIELPELDSDQSRGYMGHDSLYLSNNAIVRQFPLFRDNDTNSKPTGGNRKVVYELGSDYVLLERK